MEQKLLLIPGNSSKQNNLLFHFRFGESVFCFDKCRCFFLFVVNNFHFVVVVVLQLAIDRSEIILFNRILIHTEDPVTKYYFVFKMCIDNVANWQHNVNIMLLFFAQQKEWCIYAQTNTQFACIFCVFFNKRTVQRKPGDLQDKRRVCQSISIDHIVCIMHKKAERRQLMAVSKLCHLTKTYFFNIQSNNLKKEEKFNTQSGLNMIVSYDIIYYHVYMII